MQIRPLFLSKINPEIAHKVALFALKYSLVSNKLSNYQNHLRVKTLGLAFDHPVGLSAGFDKNAECARQLLSCGFSYVEVGTITVKPQRGNDKPRIFRLLKDRAIINRLGFNGNGLECFQRNFEKPTTGLVGVNIGKNKDTLVAVSDYIQLIRSVHDLADYITINISSPNTKGLRDLHQKDLLEELLIEIRMLRTSKFVPMILKISPDIDDHTKEDIAALALKYKISGLILTNTTLGCREKLKSKHKAEQGGMSGKPLFELSTQILKDMYRLTNGKTTLIASGGIFNGYDAYEKIKAGASLVQIYTALIYKGFGVIDEINLKLIELLKNDGFNNIQEAVGLNS